MKNVCTSLQAAALKTMPTRGTHTWAGLGFVGLFGLSPSILGLITSIGRRLRLAVERTCAGLPRRRAPCCPLAVRRAIETGSGP